MKSYKKLISSLFIILAVQGAFVSCKNNIVKSELFAIDSLQGIVINCKKILSEINTDSLTIIKDSIFNGLDYIKTNYNDSLTHETARLLTDYNKIYKTITIFTENSAYYKQELAYSKKQLENLKNDIDKGFATEKKFNEFFAEEYRAVINLEKPIIFSNNAIKTLQGQFILINPKIQDIISELNSKK